MGSDEFVTRRNFLAGLGTVSAAVALGGSLGWAPAAQAAAVRPLERAHAHNDYEHARPLFDALDHGFTSVEADIWLVDDELLVAHDLADVRPGRTLRSLYLDPLRERVRANRGNVYSEPVYFQLVIDIKSEARGTYDRLEDELLREEFYLSKFTQDRMQEAAVTVVLGGNVPQDHMESQRVRFAGYDGRPNDLGTLPRNVAPMISDNWFRQFSWDGSGPMPQDERDKLRSLAKAARDNEQRLRFWATPDQPSPQRDAVWTELVDAGIGFINTDHLTGLADFLRANDPDEQAA